jgi:lipopolysaccharide/colanic/teichoic acid biosynthesis glycosyltransferase
MQNKVSILYIGGSSETMNHLRSHPEIVLTACGDLQAAENHLKTDPQPDAILSELYLSGGNGMELHEQLRKDPAYKKVAFILLSHEFRDELFTTAFTNRVDDFYVLPVPPVEDLIGRIQFLRDFRNKYQDSVPEITADVKYSMPGSKRIFDLVLACSALILLSPLLLLVIIAIRLESKGKVYYTSKRVGGPVFDFYKLRSMRTGADAELEKLAKEKNQYAATKKPAELNYDEPCPRCSKMPANEKCSTTLYIGGTEICDYWYMEQKARIAQTKSAFVKISNDPRVTRVGKFIRNTSIDELPQLINVIKGDMSIVGNRPLPVYEAEQLTRGDLAKRFLAPAGITGLWQVELRGKGGVMSNEERKNYDIKYADYFDYSTKLDNVYADHFSDKKWSFWYDLHLIFRTARALFQKDSV